MAEPAPSPPKPAKSGKTTFRSLSRALHRDLGHLAVGLTFVYALSGLAVNHILDWEPSFVSYQEAHELGGPLTGSEIGRAHV